MNRISHVGHLKKTRAIPGDEIFPWHEGEKGQKPEESWGTANRSPRRFEDFALSEPKRRGSLSRTPGKRSSPDRGWVFRGALRLVLGQPSGKVGARNHAPAGTQAPIEVQPNAASEVTPVQGLVLDHHEASGT